MSKERRDEIKKKQKSKKQIIIIALTAVLVISAAAVLITNVHSCDDCGARIFGSGYYKEHESQGVLGSLFGSVFGDTESLPIETVDGVIICGECAKNNVSVKAELRGVEEFKR